MKRLWPCLIALWLGAQPASTLDVERALQEALSAPHDAAAFRSLLAALPRDGEYYVVEGDLLMTDDEVRAYVFGLAGSPRPVQIGPELVMNYYSGKPDMWGQQERSLTYSIDKASFPTEAAFATVRTNLAAAGTHWVDACRDCRLSIAEAPSATEPGRKRSHFVVRHVDTGSYVAAAFFPSYSDKRFVLKVDKSYFTTNFDRVGVLRHEIGHILGYRHEHIQNIPGCRREAGVWKPLSPYDPHSVMHYFCGGGGSMELALSPIDIDSHTKAYSISGPTGGQLRVTLVGGEVADNLVAVIRILEKHKVLELRELVVEPGGGICRSLARKSDWPVGCPPSVIELISSLSGLRKRPDELREGEVIVIPRISLQESTERRQYNPKRAADVVRRETVQSEWGPYVQGDVQTDRSGFEMLSLRIWELVQDLPSEEVAAEIVKELLEARIPNVFVRRVEPSAKRFHGATPSDFLISCGNGILSTEGDLVNLLHDGRPLPPRSCSGDTCPLAVLVDSDVAAHFDLLQADLLQPSAQPAPCKLHDRAEFDEELHHGTAMAGIIAARANGLGLIGVSPEAELQTMRWVSGQKNQYDLAGQLGARAYATPRQQVYIFASEWESGASPEGRSFASARIVHLQALLWVVAAGQSDTADAGNPIREDGSRAPMNLGDQPNVIVVTACDPCKGAAAAIPDWAHHSDKLVHVAAPGGAEVPTTFGDGGFVKIAGTSPAAAFVGGLAERLFATYPSYYRFPVQVKARLQYSSKPIVRSQDGAKLVAGVIDPEAAFLDPNKTWYKRSDGDWSEFSIAGWCGETVVTLRDPVSRAPLPAGHLDLARVFRIYRHDSGFPEEQQPLFTAYIVDPNVNSKELTVNRVGRGWVNETDRARPLVKLTDGTTKALKDIWDLIGSPFVSNRIVSCGS